MNFKLYESLRLIRLNVFRKTQEEFGQLIGLNKRKISDLEIGKLDFTPFYQDKINSIYEFHLDINKATENLFNQWRKKVYQSHVMYDGQAKTIFNQCPLDLSIIKHTPLYIDYKVLEFIVCKENFTENDIQHLNNSLFIEDFLNYYLFRLYFSGYLHESRNFNQSKEIYCFLKPYPEYPMINSMYHYIGSIIYERNNDFREANNHVIKAKNLFKSLHNEKRYYFSVMQEAIILMCLQEYEKSTKLYYETLEYFKEKQMIPLIYSTLCNVSWNHLLTGNYDKAEEIMPLIPAEAKKGSFYYFIYVVCAYKSNDINECLHYIDLCIENKDTESFNTRYCKLIKNAIKYGENYRYELQAETIYNRLVKNKEFSNARFMALQLHEHYKKRRKEAKAKKWFELYTSKEMETTE